jgi:hypothetical protein
VSPSIAVSYNMWSELPWNRMVKQTMVVRENIWTGSLHGKMHWWNKLWLYSFLFKFVW